MPNGRPGDHPLTDITVHGTLTYSRKADGAIRRIEKRFPGTGLWDLLYLLYRGGRKLRREEADGAMPMAEFEAILQDIVATIENPGSNLSKKDVEKLLSTKRAQIEKNFKRSK